MQNPESESCVPEWDAVVGAWSNIRLWTLAVQDGGSTRPTRQAGVAGLEAVTTPGYDSAPASACR